jgi:pilus assembly protein CpaF
VPIDRLQADSGLDSSAVSAPEDKTLDPLTDLKVRAQQSLFSRLGSRLYDSSMDSEQLAKFVTDELGRIIEEDAIPLTADQRVALVEQIAANVLGHGPLEDFLEDESVTEVMVVGGGDVYVERNGRLEETGSSFVSEEHLRRVIERIVSRVGRRIDESSPMVDARLPDGSRVNAIIPPLAVDGSSLTIRKFARTPFEAEDLIGFKTLSPRIIEFLQASVGARVSMLVSGGTGTGKTTLLNVLSGYIGSTERIVSIEDSVELQLRQRHVVRLESRPPNIEGKGEVTIRDLVRNALRMRPDRIIVGEVRGSEALDMLQAMNTGHEGSLTTLHANAPRDALARLETMVLMAGMELPLKAIREQISSAIDVIVQISRLSDGSRRVTQVCEVTGMEGDVIQLSDLFSFNWDAGVDEGGNFLGLIEPTGIRPTFEKHLRDLGIELPRDLFGDPASLITMRNKRR